MMVTLGQQYIIGEKPTVILYTYFNRHAGTQENRHAGHKKKQKRNVYNHTHPAIGEKSTVILYNYINRHAGTQKNCQD